VFADLKPLYFYQCGHLTTLVYAAPSENEETLLSKHVYASRAICNRLGTFGSVRQPVIRSVSANISSGEGYFERWLYSVT